MHYADERIVLDPVLLHDVLRFAPMRKQMPVQTLGAKLAVEALDERVLPGWTDPGLADTDSVTGM